MIFQDESVDINEALVESIRNTKFENLQIIANKNPNTHEKVCTNAVSATGSINLLYQCLD